MTQRPALERVTYTNPVHGDYFADPFVFAVDDHFVAIGTGREEAEGEASGERVFALLRSTDLVSWHPAGRALGRPDPVLGDTYWAPEIAHTDAGWFMYYSAGFGDRRHHLRVAHSDDPLGPYADCGALTDPELTPFAIDPHPFRDVDGRWYLFHARDFVDDARDVHDTPDAEATRGGDDARAGTALVVQPLASMTALAGEPVTVARAHHDWQRFAADRPMYGRRYDWHTLEGPSVVRAKGRYWCLYSAGCWQDASYGVDYVVADAPLGPWLDDSTDAGPRVLKTVPGRVFGPGHCSVVKAGSGRGHVIAYHAWPPARDARRLCIDELEFTSDGPRSRGPTWTPQPAPASMHPAARGAGR